MTPWARSAWRSPTSSPRSGRSSALSDIAVGALAYLVAYGARTPLLALRALTRRRNLALILVPAVAMGAFALVLQDRLDGRVAAGAIALAVVPAPLVAPALVGRMRGRADLAGALGLGTILLSLLVIGSRGALAAGALFAATEAFAISAMVANGLPTIRDAVLLPLRILGWVGFAAVFAATAIGATSPLVDAAAGGSGPPLLVTSAIVAFAMFAIGATSSAAVARLFGGDVRAAVAGAGLRDPALGVTLAAITGGPDSTGVPLAYAVFCLVLAAFALRRR